jgi:hypothetical protein
MPASKIDKFGGMLPMWEAHLLPDGQAANATNCYLFSGALDGWRTPKLLRNLTSSTSKFAYRLPNVTSSVAFAYFMFLTNVSGNVDKLALGDITYYWVTSITPQTQPYCVLVGATASASAQNLLNALTFDYGTGINQGVTYSFNTAANTAIARLNEVAGTNCSLVPSITGNSAVFVISPDIGAAYNSIPVSESTGGARSLWTSSPQNLALTTTTFTGGTNATFDPTINAPSQFLEFPDPDTNVLKSQVVDDQFKRFYFASPSVQPEYNTTLRIQQNKPNWFLGVPAPVLAPSVTVAGGGNQGTLGILTTQGTTIIANANNVFLTPVVPTGNVQITSVEFETTTALATANWQTVVYVDINGGSNSTPTAPGTLLNASPAQTGTAANTVMVGTFANPSGLQAGVPYWIGFATDANLNVLDGDGTTGMQFFANTFSNGPPATAPASTPINPTNNMLLAMTFASSDVIEARAYVYTYISAYGEESAPSPFTLVNGWSNGIWTIGLTAPPPNDLGIFRNLAVVRIYRTVTASSGVTSYYRVIDISLGSGDLDAITFVAADTGCLAPTLTFADIFLDNKIALNIQLGSANFFPPPADLVGMVNLPNGMVAGWKNNEVWFCEPYFPHAWPPGNTIAVDFPIVGLGVTSGAVVACTSATPFVISGAAPGQMNLFKCTRPEPCSSRGSIVGLDTGVFYISMNGLIQVPNTGQLINYTQTWVSREEWDALVPQKNTRAVMLAGTYFCWGTTVGTDTSVAQTGFNIELDVDSSSFSIWPQPGGHRLGFMQMTSPPITAIPGGQSQPVTQPYNIDNVFTDPWTGQCVMILNGQEYWYDFTDSAPLIQPYDWLSKKYQTLARKNYSAIRIFFQVPPNTPPQNVFENTAPFGDASWNTLQRGQWGIIKVWADPDDGFHSGDMVLVMAREIRKNGQIFRVPDGFKAENWQIEVMGRVVISNVQFATSVQELGKI